MHLHKCIVFMAFINSEKGYSIVLLFMCLYWWMQCVIGLQLTLNGFQLAVITRQKEEISSLINWKDCTYAFWVTYSRQIIKLICNKMHNYQRTIELNHAFTKWRSFRDFTIWIWIIMISNYGVRKLPKYIFLFCWKAS